MIKFNIGRWTIQFFNFKYIGYWAWKRDGYDCLWEEWGFGFLLQLERLTDYALPRQRPTTSDDGS